MTHWPVRTGLPTANKEAQQLKNLLVRHSETQASILTPEQYEKVVALIQCLLDFLSDVPTHEPEE